jgi:hypothetical protein
MNIRREKAKWLFLKEGKKGGRKEGLYEGRKSMKEGRTPRKGRKSRKPRKERSQ